MEKNNVLKGNEIFLNKQQLEKYIEKLSIEQVTNSKSKKHTFPIIQLREDFLFITKVYELLNEDIKLGISIHSAGEWLLDNYYIIEENVRSILNELSLKKYINLPGIANGYYKGNARIYILANEIVKYTNNQIDKDIIEKTLFIYQKNKNITMEELWNLSSFLKIALVQNIRDICEKIYIAQKQKRRAKEVINNTIENYINNNINEEKKEDKDKKNNFILEELQQKYSFVEYMAYSLKKYGRQGYPYLTALEEIMEKKGITVEQIIKKEHFIVAVSKVSIGNAITSIKNISRINFQEIFDKLNRVEEILKKDPLKVYEKMTYETKVYYRNELVRLSKKTGLSEIFIANKILKLAKSNFDKGFNNIDKDKKSHVGYYLIDKGRKELFDELNFKKKEKTEQQKKALYVINFFSVTITLTVIIGIIMANFIKPIYAYLIALIIYIPVTEVYLQILNYILIKKVRPKIIPKINFNSGIDDKNATFVVIPTIVNSIEKVKSLIHKLEVFYLANKSENIYFAILGDCSTESEEHKKIDDDIIKVAKREIEILNKKYDICGFNKFHFLYRKRRWSSSEKKYLGWERKRGILHQFNNFLISKNKNIKIENNDFILNTLEGQEIPNIKYIITLDGDTILPLNTALQLIGAMAHILNKPVISNGIVIDGYGIIQPRIGIDLESVNKSIFTEIYSEQGGVDTYTNAISDIYEDNFKEAIYTGKGIYDLEVFNKLLYNTIPENQVLSHDLLESTYLKCGLASDIFLMDGYPKKYTSYISRNHRWIRGDWQIIDWITTKVFNSKKENVNNPINQLSKFKIIDNLRRSLFPIFTLILLFVNYRVTFVFGIIAILMPLILDLSNYFIYRKVNSSKQINFSQTIGGIKKSILKGFLEIVTLPDKAYISINAIYKTLYRLKFKCNLLEWTTAEEAEILEKNDLKSYYKKMFFSVIIGVIMVFYFTYPRIFLGLIWIFSPYIMWYISKIRVDKTYKDILNGEEEQYIKNIAKETWSYFETYMTQENHYLPPDNYQENIDNSGGKIALRTSSTNIGLGLLAIISAYDMKFIDKDKAMDLIIKVLNTIKCLVKWNGHLYNWYDIRTLEPLKPRYISTVDSGNFVGYLYVVKQFLIDKKAECNLIDDVNSLINNTNFVPLYNNKIRLFSIGFNIEEGKMTNSYYDFLASEARQASFVAIALQQINSKHWNSLSRTLTVLNRYKGLVSWSGTAFEYLMPNIIIKKYKDSLIDESCKFLIMSSKIYAEKLNIPWGISESAFNLKDLYGNYQYKAFGIPWLGVKRGLADEIVVAPYASILAISEDVKAVINNLKELEKLNGKGKYGFYESIDFTPNRLQYNEKYAVVKTFMAHHQALILLSINNLINNDILKMRFHNNPEIEAVDILLQEKMPRNIVITKSKKEKIEKLKYKDYEDTLERSIEKLDYNYENTNIISNDEYTIFINDRGQGYSKVNNIYINRFKKTSEENQGIKFYIKNKKSNKIWESALKSINKLPTNYLVTFSEAESDFERLDGNILTKVKVTVSPEDNVEIRKLRFKNYGEDKETLEINALIEPVLSNCNQDYAHPAFNNMSIEFEKYKDNIIIKRREKTIEEEKLFVGITLFNEDIRFNNIEYEINKKVILGRNNNGIPEIILGNEKLRNKIELTVNPMLLLRKSVEVDGGNIIDVSYIMAVADSKDKVLNLLEKYKNKDKINESFDLQKAKVETENRYLMLNSKDLLNYQEMARELLYKNYFKKNYIYNLKQNFEDRGYLKEELWKFGVSGDFPYILAKVKNEFGIETLGEILKAYEYFKLKNIKIDLIIIDEEEYSYELRLKNLIEYEIQNKQISYMINNGIFILNNVEKDDLELLEFRANLIIDTSKGNLSTIIREQKQDYLEYMKYWSLNNSIDVNDKVEDIKGDIENTKFLDNLKYSNGYGGFTQDGKEYHISINKNKKLPLVWSNILVNENFGTLVTETFGGYTWHNNCRLNRITAWNNNSIQDIPSEIIYVKDLNNKDYWTLGYSVVPKNIEYNIIYGFGYALYKQVYDNLLQENQVYVPIADNVKVNYINIRNLSNEIKKLKIIYYIKPVLGEDEIISNSSIFTNFDIENNIVYFKNLERKEKIAYISSNQKIIAYTGSKKSFIGNGSLENPQVLNIIENERNVLDNQNGLYEESIIAIEMNIELKEYENKEISLILGEEIEYEKIINIKNKYTDIERVKEELDNTKEFWNNKINKLQIKTPDEELNTMLNGWNVYQTLTSRIYAKTGYYQSGGAIGFRDQLQDTIGIKYVDRVLLKNQIIKSAEHQFKEGDVLHWWHEETNRGIRTKFSDDLLWLPYAILEYVKFTGEYSLLKEKVQYLYGDCLGVNEDERYDIYLPDTLSKNSGSIMEHLLKAIEKSLNIGENGFLKIGSGDWNDGFSSVGNQGRGESIWLTFFVCYILKLMKEVLLSNNKEKVLKIDNIKVKSNILNIRNLDKRIFSKYLKKNIDIKQKINKEKRKYYLNNKTIGFKLNYYEKIIDILLQYFRKSLNNNGWDGKWFKRAITDDGKIIGSSKNKECKIDSIAQSWSIISNMVSKEKQVEAFESLEKYLVDKENKIFKLLTPAFDKSDLNPGYIRKYINGVRENGGQYTHGSLWLVWASILLGYNDKAFEFYKMFIPIIHSCNKEEADKYMVEPYVIAADIYGEDNLIGRGGWTWYTGASAWFYKIGIEIILGLNIENDRIRVEPAVPANWEGYKIRYVYGSAIYNINVKRSNIKQFLYNGVEIPEGEIKLVDNGKINDVDVTF